MILLHRYNKMWDIAKAFEYLADINPFDENLPEPGLLMVILPGEAVWTDVGPLNPTGIDDPQINKSPITVFQAAEDSTQVLHTAFRTKVFILHNKTQCCSSLVQKVGNGSLGVRDNTCHRGNELGLECILVLVHVHEGHCNKRQDGHSGDPHHRNLPNAAVIIGAALLIAG